MDEEDEKKLERLMIDHFNGRPKSLMDALKLAWAQGWAKRHGIRRTAIEAAEKNRKGSER